MSDALKHINNPEPFIVRAREAGRARDGALPKTLCPHPVSAVEQYVDDDGLVGRNGRPTNLFQCMLCNNLLRLVDFHGKEATDG